MLLSLGLQLRRAAAFLSGDRLVTTGSSPYGFIRRLGVDGPGLEGVVTAGPQATDVLRTKGKWATANSRLRVILLITRGLLAPEASDPGIPDPGILQPDEPNQYLTNIVLWEKAVLE